MTNLVEIDRLWQVYTGTIRNGATLGSLFALLFGTLVLWLVFRIIPLQSEKNRLRGRPPLPSGRFGLPVIGETLSFFSALRNNRLGDFFQTREEKYGRVFKISLIFTQTVCLPAPAGNKFTFANENKLFRNRWPDPALTLLGKEVFSYGTPDSHRHIRQILMTFFSPESLESFVPRMEVSAAAHISKHWENQDQVTGSKCLKQFAFVLSVIVVAQEGAIVEIGKHEELLAKWQGGAYSTLVRLQEMATLNEKEPILSRESSGM